MIFVVAGVKAGLASAKVACVEHAALCSKEISRDKVRHQSIILIVLDIVIPQVKAMVKLFGEIATGAAQKEAAIAARAAVMKDIYEIAIRAAGRAAREKILAMASRGQIRLKSDWRPTSLIGVINARSDLSDIEKVRLAAKSKVRVSVRIDKVVTSLLSIDGQQHLRPAAHPGQGGDWPQ